MTRRATVLSRVAPPVDERIRVIEATPLPPNIVALLEQAARDVPEHLAYDFFVHGESITYRALLKEVLQLATGMAQAGMARKHVAVMLPNVPEMPKTWLALSRIAAVMVPVNVRYTAHELSYALSDSDADALVIHEDYLELLGSMPAGVPRIAGRIYVVGKSPGAYRPWRSLYAPADETLLAAHTPALDDVVNIQYTSGTTGLPKGCMLTQRYWLTCAKAYSDCDFRSYKRILACNPFFYMTPQWQLLMAFFQRGTLYVAPGLSVRQYTEWMRRCRIDFCIFGEAFYGLPPSPLDAQNDIVRVNIYACRKDIHADMERRYDFVARSAFGMTEVGMGMFTPIEAVEMTGSGSCGRAAPFRECRIADEQGRTLADGTRGELLIRGPAMLNGYYRKPEATAAAFHGDWFRTGDLAWRDERGYFYIIGRIKDTIRRAGENIAAGEVEGVIAAIPGVAEVAVVAEPDVLRGEEVKAHLRLAEGATPRNTPPEMIVKLCAEKLAVFKVPRFIEYHDAPLPRTASGKISKSVLVASERTGGPVWDRITGRYV